MSARLSPVPDVQGKHRDSPLHDPLSSHLIMQEILPCFQPLLDLSWQTLRLELRNTRNTFARQHPLAVFAAICKHAAKQAGIPHNQYFYHPLDGPPDDRIRKNTIYPLELVFPASDTVIPDRFLSGLKEHLANPRNNFSLHSSEPARTRCLGDLLTENPLRNPDEVCLEFLTPFPFTPKAQGQNHLIDRDIFFRKLEARIKRTFDLHLPDIASTWAEVYLLSCYWAYYERQRDSGSNKGKQYLNGTVGPLYLRGAIEPVYPLILLCSEINNGRRSAFGLGHYKVLHNSVPGVETPGYSRQSLRDAVSRISPPQRGD